ncbi:WXG100 family type VII secretion target [Umezawaea endophytica]|uniref:WXG100 family type VII secretion target n=1 Tax=Umezawaea endophytica TaxID=1654476 RepID=A0A9X2ZY11_9PSEU|nr:WXG100 family type VII secretion target [Umezawaea endophytica]MCS7475964.1 WXG100 family type VII secretion target [Umezawaea endophytica]
MAPTYAFNFQIADSVRDTMASCTRAVLDQLDDLDTMATSSMAGWDGAAREAYAVHKANWDSAAARMPEALGRVEAALHEISGGYLKVEHYAHGMWL